MVAEKEVRYKKEFMSETDEEDISYHGSSIYRSYQNNAKEETEIRKEIAKNFAVNYEQNRYQGFDGKFIYYFSFLGGPQTDLKNREKNVKYDMKVTMKKAGNKSDLENRCDLEEFLIEKGFKQKD